MKPRFVISLQDAIIRSQRPKPTLTVYTTEAKGNLVDVKA
jgi:hypothetical protein